MYRGAAAAGLTIAFCLIAAPAFAGTTARAPTTKASPSAKASQPARKSSHSGGGHSSGSGGTPGPGNVSLPRPTRQCAPNPKQKAEATPWAQRALDYPSVWKFSQGAGITVAVIDSGVDANTQFGNRVSVGPTFAKAPSGPAYSDCVGHGTEVAGIIAAAPTSGNSFQGVAPKAHILSIKVTNSEAGISSGVLASAIFQAVQAHAKVINVSIDTPVNDPSLQSAVNYALSRHIVVVAAVGNDENVTNADGSTTNQHGPFYPADYPGVLSVGAVDEGGNLAGFSDKKTHVSVTAPGAHITSTFPGSSGHAYAADDGTSFAAPFVSGLAALVLSRFPNLNGEQVTQRIEETAEGAAGPGTGNGLINPVQAVTAVLPPGEAPTPTPSPGLVSVDRATPNRSEKVVALSLAGGAFGAAVLVIAAAVVIPAGRRRRWRPGS